MRYDIEEAMPISQSDCRHTLVTTEYYPIRAAREKRENYPIRYKGWPAFALHMYPLYLQLSFNNSVPCFRKGQKGHAYSFYTGIGLTALEWMLHSALPEGK